MSLSAAPLNSFLLDVHPSRKPQIAGLIAKKALIKVFAEYADFANKFSWHSRLDMATLNTKWCLSSARKTIALLVDGVIIPTREGSLPRVGRVHPGRPWPGLKLVRVIQMFLRLLSTFFPTPPTSMLRTSSLTDSSTSASQIVVKYDGGDNDRHDNEYSPQRSRQAYQRTHQLAWPRLRLSLIGLMLVVLLAS